MLFRSTFMPRPEDGALFPERASVKQDFAAMGDAGFTVVRTYTAPPDDLVEAAGAADLKVLAGVFYPDWRYLVGSSRRQAARIQREARATVREEALRLAGADDVLALCLGNELPADVVRWLGTGRVAAWIDALCDEARQADPDRLVTYANYPTAEYLPLDSLDFLTFNVFLENQNDFRRYLTRLHHLAGERPLVLGEVGLDAGTDVGGVVRQAQVLHWQLRTAMERGVAGTCVFSWTDEWAVGGRPVEGWHFGLTDAGRAARPALEVASMWNRRTAADLVAHWPSISVVICAYNAEATLDECLRHTCALDYPDLEIVVVDDGSTDATADIARSHPRARLVSIEHGGLSVARNAGIAEARGDLIAYLDSDAYPSPEWPYYLALALDGPMVGGVGGPNVPPEADPVGAQQVARAPGGPVHVLTSDDRAEHVPGCNMAFWKPVLEEVGGFDPIYTAAGDDVDLCWKVLDRGWEIGFHPAALVWHHRRAGLRTYLHQQRGYGRAEALVAARHPDRFNSLGTARWSGRIYNSFAVGLARQRVYHGVFGAGAYQSVYQDRGHARDLAHQIGVPLSLPLLLTFPLGLVVPLLTLPAALALVFLLSLFATDVAACRPPAGTSRPRRFRAMVALLHLVQPPARHWARYRHVSRARTRTGRARVPGPVRRVGRSAVLLPATQPRADTAAGLVASLRDAGWRVDVGSGWDAHDALVVLSPLFTAELVSSAHPEGCVQARLRRLRPRRWRAVAVVAAVVVAGLFYAPAGAGLAGLVVVDVLRSWRRTRHALVAAVEAAPAAA